MKNIFNHYYLFTKNVINDRMLTIGAKAGHYAPLEADSNAITKIVMTASHPLHLNKKAEAKFMMNPFMVRWVGLAHYNHHQDPIIVIGNPALGTVELFISENNKKISTLIYNLLKFNELDEHLEQIKALAQYN